MPSTTPPQSTSSVASRLFTFGSFERIQASISPWLRPTLNLSRLALRQRQGLLRGSLRRMMPPPKGETFPFLWLCRTKAVFVVHFYFLLFCGPRASICMCQRTFSYLHLLNSYLHGRLYSCSLHVASCM